MGSVDAGELDVFDASRCGGNGGYALGLAVGRRFRETIRSRMRRDAVLREQLLPFAATTAAAPLLAALQAANRERYPRYWDELVGTADGSGVPLLQVILVNFRKEILPFIPKEDGRREDEEPDDDCSDVLLISDSTAIAAHNEDANVALLGHTYLMRATSPDGSSFTAYTYAGELPSCAFGFNSNGVAFTLDSVPPVNGEIVAGAIARNFVSRDLLEARNLEDAIHRVCSPSVSVGHSYNLMDVGGRRIVNVETASGNRSAVHEATGGAPFFHANMYRRLQVKQVQDENSMSREKRAAQCSVGSVEEALSVLGDTADYKYPIFMTGPTLYTLCTVLVDLDEKTMTIYKGNPKNRDVVRVLPMLPS